MEITLKNIMSWKLIHIFFQQKIRGHA